MEKNRRQLMILGVVVLIFIVMVVMGLSKRRPGAGKTQPAAAVAGVQTVKTVKERPASAFPNWGRDPFAVGSSPVSTGGELILTGIVWDQKRPYCILNGKVLGKGDEILGYKILEIKQDSVVVKAGDETKLLKVWRQ